MLRSKDELFEAIKSTGLPYADFIVAGSSPLLIHGLRETITDVDIVVRSSLWNRLCDTSMATLLKPDNVLAIKLSYNSSPIEILNGWFPIQLGWSVEDLIESAEVVNNINFVPLNLTLEWKKRLHRPKDAEDIVKLEHFLNKSA